MRIGFNITPLQTAHKTRGMGYYTKNLLDELKQCKDIKLIEFVDTSELENVDLVHYPYFDLFFHTLPIKKKFPTVVTIADLTPLVFSQHYPPGIKGLIKFNLQKLALKNIEAVITLSQTSRKDIKEILHIEDKKIFPIYIAAAQYFKKISDRKILQEIKNKYLLPDHFALFVGSVNWNKNLLNIAEGCLLADIDLVLIGKDFESKNDLDHPEKKSYKEFLEKYGSKEKIHFVGFVSDQDLVSIYNLASLVLLPSFYEGFGLPILEAQTCGTPVITSNTSSMPEVAGDGALKVNPYNPKEISQAIKKILQEKDFKNTLIQNGFLNIKRFSWKKCARETIQVYKHKENPGLLVRGSL